ncbi:hypothetical protein TUM4641_18100 [Shewanella morhuae]|nr:hypothetical protein TUM4641_18100 [Shewanella morhuae]
MALLGSVMPSQISSFMVNIWASQSTYVSFDNVIKVNFVFSKSTQIYLRVYVDNYLFYLNFFLNQSSSV